MILGWGLLLSFAAQAHHSNAMFDTSRTNTVKGTLHSVEWKNPHSWIWVEVSDAKGGANVYGFEAGSPALFARQGLKKQDLAVGVKVSVDFNPLRDGRTGGLFVSMTFENGRVVRLFPGPPPGGKPPDAAKLRPGGPPENGPGDGAKEEP